MPFEYAYKRAVKDELDYALKKGRGEPFKIRLVLFFKAIIRIIKLTYLYNKKIKKAGVKEWLKLEDFLKRVLSVLR